MTDEAAAELAERLREAHRRVRSADLSEVEKANLARRIIAISDAAKLDLTAAAPRLDRLLDELGTAP